MDPEEAERLLAQLEQLLVQQQKQAGFDDTVARLQGKERTPGGNWRWPDGKEPSPGPAVFDAQAAEIRLKALNTEALQVLRLPNDENWKRLESIDREMAKIMGQHNAEQSAERARGQAQRVAASQPEVDELDSDIEQLGARYEVAARRGSIQEQTQIEAELAERYARRDAIANGQDLRWKGEQP
jgi:hypothetical protein